MTAIRNSHTSYSQCQCDDDEKEDTSGGRIYKKPTHESSERGQIEEKEDWCENGGGGAIVIKGGAHQKKEVLCNDLVVCGSHTECTDR